MFPWYQGTASEFEEKYQCYLEEFRANPMSGRITNNDSEVHAYGSFTYDAVWTIALGLERTDRCVCVGGGGGGGGGG